MGALWSSFPVSGHFFAKPQPNLGKTQGDSQILSFKTRKYKLPFVRQPVGRPGETATPVLCYCLHMYNIPNRCTQPLQSTGAQSKGSQEPGQPQSQRLHENTNSTQYRDPALYSAVFGMTSRYVCARGNRTTLLSCPWGQ